MSILSREEAARKAESSSGKYPIGYCQIWTRSIFGAPSVGDVDGDKDADAVDGWRSEPEKFRHVGDRNPPRGVPLAWAGGSRGYGHRAISLGNGMVRSTDAPKEGEIGTVDLGWFERNWKVTYLGWSETISGHYIQYDQPKPEKGPGKRVIKAISLLEKARDTSENPSDRRRTIRRALNELKKL